MAVQIATAIGYLALAVLATRISWRYPMGVVGLTLCLCSLVTSAAFFGTSFGSRVTLEIGQSVAIITAARVAFSARPSFAPIAVMLLALADLAWSGVMAWSGERFDYAFSLGSNVFFTLTCLCVAAPGVRDAVMGAGSRRGRGRRVGAGRAAGDVE